MQTGIKIDAMNKQAIKSELFRRLVGSHAFWSYDPASLTLGSTTDEMLIYKVLVHLDLDDICRLFTLYDGSLIREVKKSRESYSPLQQSCPAAKCAATGGAA
jgi:hypothetical protein